MERGIRTEPVCPVGLRVLIVDDDPINLAVLSRLLQRRFAALLACRPVAVSSAVHALALLRTTVFDVCLMDIQMPYLNGIDATRCIRAASDGILPENAHMRILAITSAVGEHPTLSYTKVGMNGMIGKPVSYDDLADFLHPLFSAHEHALLAAPPPFHSHLRPRMPPFYIPKRSLSRSDVASGAAADSLRPHIACLPDFERLLADETAASLRQAQAGPVLWAELFNGIPRLSQLAMADDEEEEEGDAMASTYSASAAVAADPASPPVFGLQFCSDDLPPPLSPGGPSPSAHSEDLTPSSELDSATDLFALVTPAATPPVISLPVPDARHPDPGALSMSMSISFSRSPHAPPAFASPDGAVCVNDDDEDGGQAGVRAHAKAPSLTWTLDGVGVGVGVGVGLASPVLDDMDTG